MPAYCVGCRNIGVEKKIARAPYCSKHRPAGVFDPNKDYNHHRGGKEKMKASFDAADAPARKAKAKAKYDEADAPARAAAKKAKYDAPEATAKRAADAPARAEKAKAKYDAPEATAKREEKAKVVKLARRTQAEAYMIANGWPTTETVHARRSRVASMIDDVDFLFRWSGDERLRGKSISMLHSDPNFCAYFGETGRDLTDEALRWLTERGGLGGGRNRPTLEWAEPRDSTGTRDERTNITMTEARVELDFRSVQVYENLLKVNTTGVEDMLQDNCHRLGLPRRLHRVVGAGSSGFERHFGDDDESDFDEDGHPKALRKVFMTYSFDVVRAITKGDVVVME